MFVPCARHHYGSNVPARNSNVGIRDPFLESPENFFRARKAIFSLAVSKHRELYTPEIFCMKGTCVHLKIMRVKQLCNHNI